MIYNDTTKTTDAIIQQEEIMLFGDNGYGAITGDSDRLFQFTNRNNRAQDRFAFVAMTADGTWAWDDTNFLDYSIATTNIVSGTRTYQFALDHLVIERVLVANSSGNWNELDTIDAEDPRAGAFFENNTGRTGVPTQYLKRGNTLYLDFTPNYSASASLKVYFKRGPSYFTVSDTTKVPGFTSIFHSYIPLHACFSYAADRTMAVAANYSVLLADMEKAIKAHYSLRNKDERPALRVIQESNK